MMELGFGPASQGSQHQSASVIPLSADWTNVQDTVKQAILSLHEGLMEKTEAIDALHTVHFQE